ncbi:MAG: hypothetical protein M3N53_09710 [Actinomycetota bacterium]|nr:hypothetical protein [Actinomycetota bacterium]
MVVLVAMKVLLSAALSLTLVAGCQPDAPPAPEAVASPPASGAAGSPSLPQAPQAVVASLPASCEPWRGGPQGPQITFVKEGRLFALDPSGGRATCLGGANSYRLEWGPRGDRVLLTAGSALAQGVGFRQELPGDQRETTWSRPTGTSVVYVSHDYGSLLKEDVTTGAIAEISFLEAHHDVAYHPAGTHIAVAGQAHGGAAGLYLATNEGTQVQQIVRGEDAEYIDGLAFSHDGRYLYFRAKHENSLDLHSVRIFTGEESADTQRDLSAAGVETIYSGEQAPHFAVSPFSRRPRILLSACFADRGDALVRVGEDETVLEPELGAVDPVGWLPDHSVVFIAYERRCDDVGAGDLYSWSRGESTLLVEDVDAAAIRARLPAAPDPPAKAQGVVA